MPRLEWMFLNDKGEVATPTVLAQIDARAQAVLDAADLGSTETVVTTATRAVKEPGDFLAEVATVLTLPDASQVRLAAGEVAAIRYFAGAWRVFTASPGAVTRDETAPTAGTLAATPSEGRVQVAVTGALDDTALHAQPYRFSKDNGVTFTGWQAEPAFVFTGLASDTSYTCVHEVRDAAGNIRRGAPVTARTPKALVWSTLSADTFDAAPDGTPLDGYVPATGSALVVTNNAGEAATTQQIIGKQTSSPAAAGAWQTSTQINWAALTAYAGIRATISYDHTGSGATGYTALMIPLNAAFTNHLSIGVKADGTIYTNKYGGGTLSAATVEPTAPAIPKIGTVTVEATGPANGQGWTIKVSIGGTLHSTLTHTGQTVASTAARLQVQPQATGTAVAGIRDYKLEVAA